MNNAMKTTDYAVSMERVWRVLCLASGMLLCGWDASAADFTVTTPGGQFAFRINGVNSPTLTLVRGQTYTFEVSTTPGFHPFRILSTGVVNNNISSGTLTFTVPTAAANYTYDCSVHPGSMQGQILTVDPPTPPTVNILSLAVEGDELRLRSTGTNNWSVQPEYRTNLSSSNWFALTVRTNRYLDGTNDTICGRPEALNVFIRVRSEPE
jgi:plastocyanin